MTAGLAAAAAVCFRAALLGPPVNHVPASFEESVRPVGA